MVDKNQPSVASLGRAIKQLEALLEAHARESRPQQPPAETVSDRDLPVLNDIIEPGDELSGELEDFDPVTPTEALQPQAADAAQAREALQRLAEQMEMELEVLVGMLKENMMNEFRNKLASVLGIDPEQLDSIDDDEDNTARD